MSVRLEPDNLWFTQPLRTRPGWYDLADWPSASLPFLRLTGRYGSARCSCHVISRLRASVGFLPDGPKYLQKHHLQTGNTLHHYLCCSLFDKHEISVWSSFKYKLMLVVQVTVFFFIHIFHRETKQL